MKNEALDIVEKLQDAGFKAYYAGGSVRDMLLGKDVSDFDIATSALPDDIEKLFEKTIPVGKKFGTISVVSNGHSFEVTTFRKESDYEDRRRPANVTFTDEKEDATRRDFTVNAIFYDPVAKKYIDYVGGMEDIKKKSIRFVGNADERINEDHLRLVRAIRFKITLGFQYDNSTFEAIRKNADLIKNVSAERIRIELDKIVSSPRRHQGLIELSESGLLKNIIPELENLKGVPQPDVYHKEGDVFVHIYLALKSLPAIASAHLAWAVLLHDIAKPETLTEENGRIIFHDHAKISSQLARKILERLKFSSFAIYEICWLIENHMKIGVVDKMRPNKRLEFVLDPKFIDLIELARADASGTYPVDLSLVQNLEKYVLDAKKFLDEKKHLAEQKFFSGDDLIKMGFTPSEKFKEMLEDVNDKIVECEIKSRFEAIQYVKGKYSK